MLFVPLKAFIRVFLFFYLSNSKRSPFFSGRDDKKLDLQQIVTILAKFKLLGCNLKHCNSVVICMVWWYTPCKFHSQGTRGRGDGISSIALAYSSNDVRLLLN